MTQNEIVPYSRLTRSRTRSGSRAMTLHQLTKSDSDSDILADLITEETRMHSGRMRADRYSGCH